MTKAGHVVGTHDGHQLFTIGQRKGVGVAMGLPVYVVDIDPKENRVTLGEKHELLKRRLIATQINLLSPRLGSAPSLPCQAKIRYNHAPQPAHVSLTGEDELRVEFDEPQSAITPGQAVVLYDADVVLGGGWIDHADL
jgi:tRNA-specific 2-thiouridylase